MALNVGPDFKQRWLNVPDAVRLTFIDDLGRICGVLQHGKLHIGGGDSDIQHWLETDQEQQQLSLQRIEAAYAQRKAQLIEEARIRRQQALERSLQEKRAAQQAYAEQLQQDELRRFAEQAHTLALIRQTIEHDTLIYTSR